MSQGLKKVLLPKFGTVDFHVRFHFSQLWEWGILGYNALSRLFLHYFAISYRNYLTGKGSQLKMAGGIIKKEYHLKNNPESNYNTVGAISGEIYGNSYL